MGFEEKYILAIDLGTSGPKSALVTVQGEVVDVEFEEVPLYLFPNGGAEQSPDDWWNAIISTLKKIISKGLVPVDGIYDDRLMQMAGMKREQFPDLKKAVDILGRVKKEVARELGLNPDVVVVTGTPDVMSAAIGSGAVRDFEGHLYIGTSSWLTCHVPFKKTDIFHNMASLPSAIPGRYIIGNEQETAGACLNFLKDNILYHKDKLPAYSEVPNIYKIFDEIAEKTPAGSNGVIFTPWLYGERTPIEDPTVRSGILNISLLAPR